MIKRLISKYVNYLFIILISNTVLVGENKQAPEKEISLKSLFIIFIIGLVLLSGLFFFYKNNPNITGRAILESEGEIIDTSSINIENSLVLEDFKDIDDLILYKDFELHYNQGGEGELNLIEDSFFKDKSLEISLNHNDVKDPWILIRHKNLKEKNWENYDYINFIIKSDGKNSKFRLVVYDSDGDEFGFEDEKILNVDNWVGLKIPMYAITTRYFTKEDNGERNLDKIERYELHFINPTKTGDRRILIDSIFLSK